MNTARRAMLTLLIIAATAAAYIAVLNLAAALPNMLAIPIIAAGMWATFHTSVIMLGKLAA